MSKINLIPFAKLLAVIFALLGLVAGILYSVGGLIYDLVTTGSLNQGTALAFLALLGMPLLFTLVGFAAGVVGGWLMNRFPGILGKFVLDLDILDN